MTEKTSPIRIGIIGCGAITRLLHLPEILGNPGFVLCGLVDPVVQRARQLADLFEVKVPLGTDPADLAAWDAAVVAVPPHLHAEVCIAALRQNCHVLCEKPLATSRQDIKRILDEAGARGKVVSVIMQKYFDPSTRIVKSLLDDGLLGELDRVDLRCAQRSSWGSMNPRRFDAAIVPGGVTFETGIHWIYRLLHWFDDYRLESYADDRRGGVEANAEVLCRLIGRGQEVPCRMFFSADHQGENACVFSGRRLVARAEDSDPEGVACRFVGNNDLAMRISAAPGPPARPSTALQYANFLALLNGARDVVNPLDCGVRSLEFLLDCYGIRTPWPQPWAE